MPVRKITDKIIRTELVAWIRSGAPFHKGIALLSLHAPEIKAKTQKELNQAICNLLGITESKFLTVIHQYAKENKEKRRVESKDPQTIQRQPANRPKRRFRQEWPFLSEPECPKELKLLAADKLTAYENYVNAHEKLFDCGDLDECLATAQEVVNNYKENRLIYQELEYYREHGKVLGKHSVFKSTKRYEHLKGLNVIELVKLAEKTLPHRIWRIENEIKKGDKPHLLPEREKRLRQAQAELAEVKRLLGVE